MRDERQPWWSSHLETLIEAPGLERELLRGRRYAEAGQVISLEVAAGRVSALVQGTRPEPYRVALDLDPHDDTRWARVVADLVAFPGAWTQLLEGQLPRRARGWGILPQDPIELGVTCSCPVRDLFCKHAAAAVYALAERAAAEPLLLLAWRGRGRHALSADLAALAAQREEVA